MDALPIERDLHHLPKGCPWRPAHDLLPAASASAVVQVGELDLYTNYSIVLADGLDELPKVTVVVALPMEVANDLQQVERRALQNCSYEDNL